MQMLAPGALRDRLTIANLRAARVVLAPDSSGELVPGMLRKDGCLFPLMRMDLA